jgi:hypothetical protein
MRYRNLKILKARRIAREKRNRTTKWMKYFISSVIIALIVMFAATSAEAKNEYLGGNWRNCDAGHIEPYLQYSTDDYDYSITDSGNEYERKGWDLGVRLRFKFGHTCDKKFRKQQSDRYDLEQQIELLKICRKYRNVEMGPELELVAKRCRDMKFLKKEEKRKRTNDDLFNEIMKQEHKKQMELKKNGSE